MKKISIHPKIRQAVLERDGHCCRYCGSDSQPFHMDHVYPESKGGETSVDNLVTSCAWCNRTKMVRVGVWPKPVGYFTEQRTEVKRVRRNNLLVWGNFLLSGLGMFSSFSVDSLEMGLVTFPWFAYSTLCAVQTVKDDIRSLT
jgi:hypothetical protein